MTLPSGQAELCLVILDAPLSQNKMFLIFKPFLILGFDKVLEMC